MTKSKITASVIAALAIIIISGITLAPQTPSQVEAAVPSTGMFMNIAGIPGESTDDAHPEWIDLVSYSHSIGDSGKVESGTAESRTTGPVDHEDFSVTKVLDKASPLLYTKCCDGTHIAEITVELCRATGDKQCYMKYQFTDVIVTSVSTGGSTSESLPLEYVTFNYGKVEWTYTETDHKTGEPKGDVKASWDMTSATGS